MTGTRFYRGDVKGRISAPSSKSYSQRMILLSLVGRERVTLNGISFCDDENAAIDLARSCGASVTISGDTVVIEPDFHCPAKVNVGESATLYRLSMGVLSAMGCRTEFTGSPGLATRPVEPLIDALSKCGVKFSRKADGFYIIDASQRKNAKVFIVQDTSSQFVSAMLLYNAITENDEGFTVKGRPVSRAYLDITLDVLEDFGYEFSSYQDGFRFERRVESKSGFQVEGDYSSALFPVILGGLASEEGVKITGLNGESKQADRKALDIIAKASTGIKVESINGHMEVLASRSWFGDIVIDASKIPDSCPPVSLIGIFSSNVVTILNHERLRTKESDRVTGITDMADAYGAEFTVSSDAMTIRAGLERKNPTEYTGLDHRILMSMIVADIVADNHAEFHNLQAVNKSYPEFINDLELLGIRRKH